MNVASSILLVEDDPTDIGLRPRAFALGPRRPALEVARHGQVALVPLARCEAGAPVPMRVLLTTSQRSQDAKSACPLGGTARIVKPCSFERLADMAAQIHLPWLVHNKLPLPPP